MNKEEFIGKLQLVYVGDRNAFNEIVEDNQRLKNLVVYSKVEIDRLNNIINGLEKFVKDYIEKYDVPDTDFICAYLRDILDKLKELKEDKC